MSRPTRRFVPRLQAFDERCLPSVTAVIAPNSNILQITGDANANTITITDDGSATGVTIMADGQPVTITATGPYTIDAITVDAGGGDDVVTYNLTATMTWGRNIDVHLGTGNDTFTANMNNEGVAASKSLALTTYGEGGADKLVLNAQNFNTDTGSILNLDYVGGAGKDSVQFNYSPGALDLGSVILQQTKK